MYIMSPNAISRFVGCYYIRVDMRYLLYKYQELIVVEFVYEIYFIEHLYTRYLYDIFLTGLPISCQKLYFLVGNAKGSIENFDFK